MALIRGTTSGSINANFFVEIHILDLADITAKQISLVHTPTDANKVLIDPVGGTTQENLVDFTVVGNIIDWDGKGMETALEVGQTLRITYVI